MPGVKKANTEECLQNSNIIDDEGILKNKVNDDEDHQVMFEVTP